MLLVVVSKNEETTKKMDLRGGFGGFTDRSTLRKSWSFEFLPGVDKRSIWMAQRSFSKFVGSTVGVQQLGQNARVTT